MPNKYISLGILQVYFILNYIALQFQNFDSSVLLCFFCLFIYYPRICLAQLSNLVDIAPDLLLSHSLSYLYLSMFYKVHMCVNQFNLNSLSFGNYFNNQLCKATISEYVLLSYPLFFVVFNIILLFLYTI